MLPSASPASETSSGTEQLLALLEDMHAACHDIQLSMIVTQDGFTMATMGGIAAADGERVGALSAGLLALCRNTARELDRGEMEQVLLRGGEGYLLLRLAGPRAMLAVIARPDANLGMVLLDTERAAEAVARLL
jgi:hypothetical protein